MSQINRKPVVVNNFEFGVNRKMDIWDDQLTEYYSTPNNLFNANYYPLHAEVRGATNEGRYYIKGRGTVANLGIQLDL